MWTHALCGAAAVLLWAGPATAQCGFMSATFSEAETDSGDAKKDQLADFTRNDTDTYATTAFGTRINDTNSLKAGLRGPTLLEDFLLREKIMMFDHERIPERVVHARGVAAHGQFQSYGNWSNITAAQFLHDPSIITPVFVRFSTVLGSRGSADTVRDVRGFATRFFTQQGNWDLVGNDIPVFFIQDAIKFPDLIHAAKPEQNTEVPQAGTAHNTAYDWFSLNPESMHTLLWALSPRGLPRSLRQVEGFGVHTFRFVNNNGTSVFVKFHWKPTYGLTNLLWDEAQKIAGKNADFHRTDLYGAINAGAYPEWELGVQMIQEGNETSFDFDILDATKLWPEEQFPVTRLGKMTLNRNVDNYFAETEQVSFHLGHVVPGIDFTDDPLLQGRLFSYLDTQINRHGSTNYFHLPINRPVAPVHNNYRDGFMQDTIFKGPVAYYPNSLNGNSPHVASPREGGYQSYPENVCGAKQRGKSPTFFDYFSQAQLFYNSQTDAEKQQLINAARFEIGKVTDKAIQQRMVTLFNHVDNAFARDVAAALGVPPPDPVVENKNQSSPALSIDASPRVTNRYKQVAVLAGDGVSESEVSAFRAVLEAEGVVVDIVAPVLGLINGTTLTATKTFSTADSVLYDATYVPGGSAKRLSLDHPGYPPDAPETWVRETYRHSKPLAGTGDGVAFLQYADIPGANATAGSSGYGVQDGVLVASGGNVTAAADEFSALLLQGRFWSRQPMDKKLMM